jgi:hypothetical protein
MRSVQQKPKWTRFWVPLCAALALTMPGIATQRAHAQYEAASAAQRAGFTGQQLDQMLAPIALYPDALLSQILMAATYPLEVVEAARWSRANPQLQGRRAVDAVEPMRWDASVKSLVAFPRILTMMSERLEWTRDLGDAFLEQEPHVMDTIQSLRRRALAAGTLRSSPEVRVVERDGSIFIEPVEVEVAYVPYYDPVVAYGDWWWPAYPPVRWAPWPGYVVEPSYASAFYWGPAIAVGPVFFFGAFDWHRRHAVVHRHHHDGFVGRARFADRDGRWFHDPIHRRGVDYRNHGVRQRIAREHAAARADRRADAPHVQAELAPRRDASRASPLTPRAFATHPSERADARRAERFQSRVEGNAAFSDLDARRARNAPRAAAEFGDARSGRQARADRPTNAHRERSADAPRRDVRVGEHPRASPAFGPRLERRMAPGGSVAHEPPQWRSRPSEARGHGNAHAGNRPSNAGRPAAHAHGRNAAPGQRRARDN